MKMCQQFIRQINKEIYLIKDFHGEIEWKKAKDKMTLCERRIRLDKRFFYNFANMLASVMIHIDARRKLTWSF